MTAQMKEAHRYVALDSLRGICACMIILHHFPSQNAVFLSPFVKNAYLFVDFFFVLSGFVIGTSYGARLASGYSAGRYMIQRFFRIYPLHAFMLMVFLAFEGVLAIAGSEGAGRVPFSGDYSLTDLLASLGLVQIFVGPDTTPWNGPSWSIAAEFWAYILFALVMKTAPRLVVPICAIMLVACPLYLAQLTDRNMYVFHDGALVRCLFGFSAGVLCWVLPRFWIERALPSWLDTGIELGAILAGGSFVWFAGASTISLFAPFVFFGLILVFARSRGAISTLLLRGPMRAVGDLSYSIYMVHLFIIWRFLNVLSVGERLTGLDLLTTEDGKSAIVAEGLVNAVLFGVLFAGVLCAAAFTRHFVEEPGRLFGRRIAGRA